MSQETLVRLYEIELEQWRAEREWAGSDDAELQKWKERRPSAPTLGDPIYVEGTDSGNVNEGGFEDRFASEGGYEERPVEESPVEESPVEERPVEERLGEERPVEEGLGAPEERPEDVIEPEESVEDPEELDAEPQPRPKRTRRWPTWYSQEI